MQSHGQQAHVYMIVVGRFTELVAPANQPATICLSESGDVAQSHFQWDIQFVTHIVWRIAQLIFG